LDFITGLLRSYYKSAVGYVRRLPVLVGSKNDAVLTPGDIRALWVKHMRTPQDDDSVYLGPAAEARFLEMNPKRFVKGFRYHFKKCPVEHCCEIWEHGVRALWYAYQSSCAKEGNTRCLDLRPSDLLSKMVRMADPRNNPTVQRSDLADVVEYDSPEKALGETADCPGC